MAKSPKKRSTLKKASALKKKSTRKKAKPAKKRSVTKKIRNKTASMAPEGSYRVYCFTERRFIGKRLSYNEATKMKNEHNHPCGIQTDQSNG